MDHSASLARDSKLRDEKLADPRYQAYEILHWGFVTAPLLAGADKLTNLLTSWESYLSPAFARLSPLSAHATMVVVGAVEMLTALLVALRPRIGAHVVAAWLVAIMLDLLLLGKYYDVALRALGLFLGALALGRLSQSYGAPARTPE